MKHGPFAFVAALCIVGSLSTEALAQQSDALARIKASGAMTVAYSPDSLPFSFTGPDSTPAGYSIDDGTIATIQQRSAPGLRIGDRVLVSDLGIQLLR